MPVNTITFTLKNQCSSEVIWPAIQGSLEVNGNTINDPIPAGLALNPFKSFTTAPFPVPWSGRIWARQHCKGDGTNCRVGDCGASSCWGKSTKAVTLFEVTAEPEKLWYNLSLVDGYTTGISVVPDKKGCKTLTCDVPPFLGGHDPSDTLCPATNLKLSNPELPFKSLDQVDGCLSDCSLYGTDEYCCQNAWNDPNKCPASSAWFKEACPDAYSYPYDDTAVNTCELSDITIVFSCKKK
ncbi:hypothetical protein FOXYSP1_20181 [Fusarium oxysporum f. sp. phaseoli]